MSCARHRRALSDGLDGALSPRRRRRLERHLASCLDCRDFESRLRRLQGLLPEAGRGAFTPERGREFLLRLRRRLEAEPRPAESARPARSLGWKWASAGATVATAALLAWLLIPRPLPDAEVYLLSDPDTFSGLDLQVVQDPELQGAFDELLRASILESVGQEDEVLPAVNPFENPLLAEGLSEAEMEFIGQVGSTESPR